MWDCVSVSLQGESGELAAFPTAVRRIRSPSTISVITILRYYFIKKKKKICFFNLLLILMIEFMGLIYNYTFLIPS